MKIKKQIQLLCFALFLGMSCSTIQDEDFKPQTKTEQSNVIRSLQRFFRYSRGVKFPSKQSGELKPEVNKREKIDWELERKKLSTAKQKYPFNENSIGFGSQDLTHPMCTENELEQNLYQFHVDLVNNKEIIDISKNLDLEDISLPMNYKVYGHQNNPPIILIHGLLGDSEYLTSLAKQLANQNFRVYIPDQRNHGNSPHHPIWNYEVLSMDLLRFVCDYKIETPILIGHSIGGKVAMDFHLRHPNLSSKLVVIDMVPKQYPEYFHTKILDCLNKFDLSEIQSRDEAFSLFDSYFEKPMVRDFYLKRVIQDKEGKFVWKMNLKAINDQIPEIRKDVIAKEPVNTDILFFRGGKSDFMEDYDIQTIKSKFPNAKIETYEESGHWLQNQEPERFFKDVIEFVEK